MRDKIDRNKKSAKRSSSSSPAPKRSSLSKPKSKPQPKPQPKPKQKLLVKTPPKPLAKPLAKPSSGKPSAADALPVLRLRTALIGLAVLALCIAGPLALVWKQSYINAVSIRLENRAEALKSLSGEITKLRLESGRLSSASRIERIAASRGFEYPPSGNMVILGVEPHRPRSDGMFAGILARVRSFISGEEG